jgi:nucleotide-binding universal stress UspA family protein
MHYLVPTASVHVTAAACDLLDDSLDAGDVVTLLGVVEPGADGGGGPTRRPGEESQRQDVEEAFNVARTRLPGADVRMERREGAPDEAILDVAREIGADRIVMGVHRGTADAAGLGGTTASVLVAADVPVTVLPIEQRAGGTSRRRDDVSGSGGRRDAS